jgi:hypothetical protein
MQLVGISLSAEKTGAVSARVPFYGTSVSEAYNAMSARFLGMQRTGFDIRQEQDGNFVAVGFYEGVLDEGGGASYDSDERTVYDWSPSFEQADIRTHPKFGELLKKYYGTLDENEEVTWGKYVPQGTGSGGGLGGSGDSANFIDNPMRGVREFYALGGVWSQKRVYPSIPGDVFTSVGRITDDPPGNLPAPGNRFWLTLPPIVTQKGQKWEVTRRWMLSGEKSAGAKEAAQDIYESLNG